MSPATAAAHEAPPRTSLPATESRGGSSTSTSKTPPRTLESLLRGATDDEILGLTPARKSSTRAPFANDATAAPSRVSDGDFLDVDPGDAVEVSAHANPSTEGNRPAQTGISDEITAALDANPDLRSAWQDAQAFRETFASPEEAKAGAVLLADLNRMDALFFSRRPEDHQELARSIADLDPAAFASLAQAIARQASASSISAAHNPAITPTQQDASRRSSSVGAGLPPAPAGENSTHTAATPRTGANPAAATQAAATNATPAPGPSPAQTEFFHATNAATVEGVLEAIESQVERLLPEGVSKSARARVVGEIYRELDTTLRSNRQLTQQMRDAFRSGALDADHQRAIVSLVTGRARQALPAVAKRVLNEWTSTIVAANNDRRTRQRTAERRVDIANSSGSSTGGNRSSSPREINYSRMSDADILNM